MFIVYGRHYFFKSRAAFLREEENVVVLFVREIFTDKLIFKLSLFFILLNDRFFT